MARSWLGHGSDAAFKSSGVRGLDCTQPNELPGRGRLLLAFDRRCFEKSIKIAQNIMLVAVRGQSIISK